MKRTVTCCPAIQTRRSPKSICICRPGAASNRTVATSAASSSRRRSATTRCTVRTLASTPRSASNCATTTAFPSASFSSSVTASARAASSRHRAAGPLLDLRRRPRRYRRTVLRATPSSFAILFAPQPRAASSRICRTASASSIDPSSLGSATASISLPISASVVERQRGSELVSRGGQLSCRSTLGTRATTRRFQGAACYGSPPAGRCWGTTPPPVDGAAADTGEAPPRQTRL